MPRASSGHAREGPEAGGQAVRPPRAPMKGRRKVVALTLALLLVAGLGSALALPRLLRASPAGAGGRDGFSPQELGLLREGDIVLRRGDSLASSLIVRVLGSPSRLSHCALVVGVDSALLGRVPEDRISFLAGRESLTSGGLAVIHAVSAALSKVDGIQIEDLGRFNERSAEGSLVVVRPRMTEAQRAASMAHARTLLAQALPFDNAYRLDAEGPLYCSELFHRVFSAASWEGQAAWEGQGGILSFDGFLDPRFFDLVLSHNPAVPLPSP